MKLNLLMGSVSLGQASAIALLSVLAPPPSFGWLAALSVGILVLCGVLNLAIYFKPIEEKRA